MYLKRVLYGLAAGLLVFISSVSNSSAAPQILGLVVTMAPTPLLCGDRVCKAEFTSFCLQKERDVPHVSWAYEVAGGKSLHLVVIGRDGVEHRIAAAPHMTIRAHRGFAAVELSLSREKLVELGGVSVSIDVGSGVSLVPVARSGDDDPISAQERSLATGPLRRAGARVVDQDPEVMSKTRVLNGMINALPDRILVGDGAREALWRQSRIERILARDEEALTTARREYEACWRNTPVVLGIESVRHCLQVRHDGVIMRKNDNFWRAVRTGS